MNQKLKIICTLLLIILPITMGACNGTPSTEKLTPPLPTLTTNAEQPNITSSSEPTATIELGTDQGSSLTKEAKKYIGYWQRGMGVSSTYGQRYAFREDGSFWWAESGSLGGVRLIAKKGRWQYTDGQIILTTTDEYWIVGGRETDFPISADGILIVGGELKQFNRLNSVTSLAVTSPSTPEDTARCFLLGDIELYNYDNQPDFFDEDLYNDATFAYSETSLNLKYSGTWNRTNVERAQPATMEIYNLTKEGFDFSIEALYWSHMGSFEGRAVFTEENRGICREIEEENSSNEVVFEFVLHEEILTLIPTKVETVLVASGVTIGGDYTLDDPVYTDEAKYQHIVPNEQIENTIRSMMDQDAFDDFSMAAHLGYITKKDIDGYSLYNIQTRTVGGITYDILIMEDKVYLWDVSHMDPIFYTNDEDYLNSDVYQMASEAIDFD